MYEKTRREIHEGQRRLLESVRQRVAGNDPTPEQIRALCEVIRQQWTKAETERRLVSKPLPVEVPIVNYSPQLDTSPLDTLAIGGEGELFT